MGDDAGNPRAQKRPDLLYAYVGSGQMVDQQETDRRMYAETLGYARRVGDVGLAAASCGTGRRRTTTCLPIRSRCHRTRTGSDFEHGDDFDHGSTYPANLFVREYSLTEQFRSAAALMDTFAVLYPQLQDVDFRRDVTHLDVPVFAGRGSHEAPGRLDLAREWFAAARRSVQAAWIEFDRSGHTPHLHEPGRFAAYLAQQVVPRTYRRDACRTTTVGPGRSRPVDVRLAGGRGG